MVERTEVVHEPTRADDGNVGTSYMSDTHSSEQTIFPPVSNPMPETDNAPPHQRTGEQPNLDAENAPAQDFSQTDDLLRELLRRGNGQKRKK